jgi:excisionase family DNA binding protein
VNTPPPELLVTVVPADVAVILLARAGLVNYRRDHRGEHWRTDQVLLELSNAAHRWRELSGRGRNSAPNADTVPSFGRMTTEMAAARLGLSARTVRRAISTGHLPAERIGNAYLIARDDVDQYRQKRGT